MVKWEENKPQALILTPTRELADQVKEDITNIGRFKRIKAAAVYGKHPFCLSKRRIEAKMPCRCRYTRACIWIILSVARLYLTKLTISFLDEADEMLNMGFIDQVEAIINQLPKNQNDYAVFSNTS